MKEKLQVKVITQGRTHPYSREATGNNERGCPQTSYLEKSHSVANIADLSHHNKKGGPCILQ